MFDEEWGFKGIKNYWTRFCALVGEHLGKRMKRNFLEKVERRGSGNRNHIKITDRLGIFLKEIENWSSHDFFNITATGLSII